MTTVETKFWEGYRAALDDVERAILRARIHSERQVMSRLAKIRAEFNLPLRDDSGRSSLPEEFHDYVDKKAQETLVGNGIAPEAANELLAFARRAGREMSEIATEDDDDA